MSIRLGNLPAKYSRLSSFLPDSVFHVEWTFDNSSITGVEKLASIIPTQYLLSQNYPNPFNPTTVISFSLPQAGHVTLKVYDILGREVATLVDGYMSAGVHDTKFSALFLSGMYVYRLQVVPTPQLRKCF